MAIFDEKIEIIERCKGVHCVDLGESFPTLLLCSLVQIFIFQFRSMSLFLNLLFETDSYSNAYLLGKFGFDTAENLASIQPFTVR